MPSYNPMHSWKPTLLDEFGTKKVKKISFGPVGGAAVTTGGSLYTWGEKWTGQGSKAVPTPRRLRSLKGIKIVDAAMGGSHGAAVSDDGEVFTWGWGGSWLMQQGALGHGDKIDQPKPALVEFFEQEGVRVSQIACGSAHTLALDTEGTVWTWGEGEFGRLGNGVASRALPTKVELPDDSVRCVQVAAGKDHSFALDSTGVAWGFGKNGHGQLGLLEVSAVDVNACESVPQPLEVIRDAGETVIQINGGNRNGIALTESGNVYIWGDRLHLRPHRVDAWQGLMEGEVIVQVAAGRNSWGALTSFGRVYTWGRNMFSGALAQSGSPQPKLLLALHDISVQKLFLGHKGGAAVVGTPPRAAPALPAEPLPAPP